MDLIKLTAFDAEDLKVVSAHFQDALVRIGDIRHFAREKRFALVASRFNWLASRRKGLFAGRFERRFARLHFNHVRKVQACHIRQDAKDGVLELLSIEFQPGDEPAGMVILKFANPVAPAAIRLDVECIDATMADLGPAWSTRRCPVHPLDEAAPGARG